MSDMKRKFVQRGNVVEVVTTVEKEELTTKNVLDTLKQFKGELDKLDSQIVQADNQKAQLLKQQDHVKGLSKDLEKFREWAERVEKSKVVSLIPQVQNECKEAVEEEYKNDPTLDERTNKLQMFALYQRKMATHEKIKDELSNETITREFFVEPKFENPFL